MTEKEITKLQEEHAIYKELYDTLNTNGFDKYFLSLGSPRANNSDLAYVKLHMIKACILDTSYKLKEIS